ncbi:MAG: protein-glutamate O-methyltransferase CheR [Gammaproteobacteria bacterium]
MNATVSPEAYQGFQRFLEESCGIVFGDNRHYLVSSRLHRVMQEHKLGSLDELLKQLHRSPNSGLREVVIDAMTTNETFWFRDGYPFEVLKTRIFPELAKKKRGGIRVWSAACSTGQEAYSISIAAQEWRITNPGTMAGEIQIIGTDISPSVLRQAKEGRYDEAAIRRGVSQERQQRFFRKVGDMWEVRPEIKSRATFREGNLLGNYALLGRFDIIFCRNVLIYFSSELKRDIISRMSKILNPGGYLFLGSSESLSAHSNDFEMVRCNPGVVYKLRS